MENYIVYKHTNTINGKIYIGITKQQAKQRWCQGHGYRHNSHFTNAIKKYGWNNFKHDILFKDLSEGQARTTEKQLISEYKSNNKELGYNKSLGGEPMYGVPHSEETKRKMSIARKNKIISQETKDKLSVIMMQRPQKMKDRFRLSQTGVEPWNKGLFGKFNPNYGKKRTDEQRQNISNSLKGKKKSAEHIEKMRINFTGRRASKETRAKLSESHQGHKHNQAKPVVNLTTGEYFPCIKYASEKYNVSLVAISNCCNGITKTSAKQKWAFCERKDEL